jgi:serine/threonine protein kinase
VTGDGDTGGDDGRTVFVPHADSDRTVFEPAAPVQPLPVSAAKGIKVGDILNHIFEVKRFIARGGMGEVFEGANAITEERVAIKVMLPALAADPNVISLFRREAKTLTRLHHEAVVQYRVLAQEPQLGVLYIVTEYIDGTNLSDVLGTLAATPAELAALLRRLASGLRAAHALGAIHRDISPDNVLLGGGDLARAKIIDFGIAKDLDPGTATIVGDGFAGKLGYVAPEQLGDFNRRLGPWTDVYSLALVILAVAKGRDVGLGGSLVDAVDKRRAGPDLSAAPDNLRPLLEKMTRADPEQRLASMDAVLAELAAIDAPPPAAPVTKAMSRWLPLAIGAGVVLAIVAALMFLFGREKGPGVAAPTAIVASRDPVEAARNAINAALPSVNCTWLRVAGIQPGAPRTKIALTGVAGNPSMAQAEISHALASQGIGAADLDFSDVSPITQAGCAALDAYRQISARDGNRLTVPQRRFEMRRQKPDASYTGIAANAVIGITIADPARDFTLVGLEPSGKIDMLIPNRAAFKAEVEKSRDGLPITDLGGDRYRLQIDIDHEGWSGLLLVSGTGPFDTAVVAPPLGARDAAWRDKLVSLAAERGWQADMVWFKSVDDIRD